MSAASDKISEARPFGAIVVGLAMVVLVIGGERLNGYVPPPSLPQDAASQTRVLQVADAADGDVIVRDAATGALLATYHSGEGSFFRATLRTLVNDRRHKGLPLEGNFRLETHRGNQLFLIDEVSGKTLSMNAFGPANTAVFSAFMFNHNKGEGL